MVVWNSHIIMFTEVSRFLRSTEEKLVFILYSLIENVLE